jgi:hypothetical protein
MQGGHEALHGMSEAELEHFESLSGAKQGLPGLSNAKVPTPSKPYLLNVTNMVTHRGLMERDEWKNLGMADVADDTNDAPNKTEPPEKSQKT